jgi:flagellar hook assembly protein FlgD
VYDVAGRLVRRLVDERRMPAGTHERDWNGFDESGRPAAPGVYYYRLQTSSDSASRKMLLLR